MIFSTWLATSQSPLMMAKYVIQDPSTPFISRSLVVEHSTWSLMMPFARNTWWNIYLLPSTEISATSLNLPRHEFDAIEHYYIITDADGPRYHFEMELSKFLSVVGPWARGLKCLEGAQITADHVYIVFLGIVSQHEEEFHENKHRLLNSTMESTHQIANGHFDELVNEMPQSHDLYVCWDYHTVLIRSNHNVVYQNAPIYMQVNPMAGPTFTITKSVTGVITCATKPPQDMVTCAALALQRILRHEYGDSYKAGKYPDPIVKMKLCNPILTEISPTDALASFCTQFKAYIKGKDPFNRKMRTNESTLGWWKALQKDELAKSLFGITIFLLPFFARLSRMQLYYKEKT
ncbi:hypothetical protein EV702DRAFT_1050280 [Suillus placidus]|uniref:Uncharacterized protein n=1 Tax=Suillus placidus TaxID=48579 RepID=A0A9P7CX79_9AGAM|nr:hypothetical protein EV702DRAFT_1050280 [Suillus placidus]